MKRILTTVTALCSVLLLVLITSCKKDGTQTTGAVGNSGTLAASTTTPALSLANGSNTAVIFNVSAATPVTGYQATVTYTLQIGKKGSNFIVPQEVSAAATGATLTQNALNDILHNLKLVDGVSTQVEVRLKSAIAPNVDAAYSNVITLTVTPYSKTSYLYVPGAYQDWKPDAVDVGVLASPTSNNVYDGKITFPAGKLEFKITPQANWNAAYGNAGGGKISLSAGDNLSVPSAGTYVIHVDVSALTYTITKQ
ncbi:SusE domain-containing protein [Mucilaginibacter galii]|uniref:DUF5116 domain-containing protein n=1 Tax=Mucilaginibacter galii TaxID=2005073 RepID=A0A917J653_9SPHI|nr:SusE domain-containing protein [Mucilaginibacter galii]GGI49389.1 hypothetical protein GCM10011425_06010 [Mucilaginibacter galii]